MPRLPVVISKPVEEEAPPEMVIRPSVVRVPIPERLPVAEISQSEVLISPVSPLSPKMKRPAVWKLAAMEAAPSKKAALSTSNPPTIKRSLIVSIVLEVAVATPNLEYAAEAKPPTCNVLPVRRYEAEAVPWTSARPEETNKARPVEENVVEPEKVLAPVPV